MRVPRAVVAAGLAFGSSVAAAQTADKTAVLYHWWAAPSEVAALNALAGVFRARYPGLSAEPVEVPQGGGAAKVFPFIKNLVSAGQAPDAFQMHAGYATQPFVDADLLSPIDELWASEGLTKAVPSVVREMCRMDGHYYAVPLGVHRVNVVWYNKALLDRHKIDPKQLKTWEAFFKAADTLRAGGIQPIQMGESWTASMVFQGIMVSLGIEAYEDWVNGKISKADDARILEALRLMKQYLRYVNQDHATLGWTTAIERVIKGRSAFCVMGDWANGEFQLANLRYGTDYGTIPIPGTGPRYGVTVDAFLRPRDPAHPASSERWLRVVASRDGQDAFNVKKGSIPARNDAVVTKYDAYQKAAIRDFRASAYVYPSLDPAVPDAYRNKLEEVLAEFAKDLDASRAASSLAKETTRLSKDYSRVWNLK
jgi:glucose/mannose transport system substrate-binding protein